MPVNLGQAMLFRFHLQGSTGGKGLFAVAWLTTGLGDVSHIDACCCKRIQQGLRISAGRLLPCGQSAAGCLLCNLYKYYLKYCGSARRVQAACCCPAEERRDVQCAQAV